MKLRQGSRQLAVPRILDPVVFPYVSFRKQRFASHTRGYERPCECVFQVFFSTSFITNSVKKEDLTPMFFRSSALFGYALFHLAETDGAI
jgi:hypothetical protein